MLIGTLAKIGMEGYVTFLKYAFPKQKAKIWNTTSFPFKNSGKTRVPAII